jgi:hypothetical protein
MSVGMLLYTMDGFVDKHIKCTTEVNQMVWNCQMKELISCVQVMLVSENNE